MNIFLKFVNSIYYFENIGLRMPYISEDIKKFLKPGLAKFHQQSAHPPHPK
jgi:hypothetical protein